MNKEEFYNKVAEILGVEESPNDSIGYGRWKRGSGGGRYIGIGVIRWYSHTFIHVMFHTPYWVQTYDNPQEALEHINELGIKTY